MPLLQWELHELQIYDYTKYTIYSVKFNDLHLENLGISVRFLIL